VKSEAFGVAAHRDSPATPKGQFARIYSEIFEILETRNHEVLRDFKLIWRLMMARGVVVDEKFDSSLTLGYKYSY